MALSFGEKRLHVRKFKEILGSIFLRNTAEVAVCGFLLTFWSSRFFGFSLVWLAVFGALSIYRSPIENRGFKAGGVDFLLALFVFFSVVSTFFSLGLAGLFALWAMIPALFIYILISRCINTERGMGALILSLAASCLFISAVIIFEFIFSEDKNPVVVIKGIGSSLLFVPNDVAFLSILSSASILVMLSLDGKVGKSERVGATISLIVVIVAVVLMQSRVGLLTFAVSVVAFLSRREARNFWKTGAGLVFLGLCVDGFLDFKFLEKIARTGNETRYFIWNCAFDFFKISPVLGNGAGSFGGYYKKRVVDSVLDGSNPIDLRYIPWPHNVFLEVLAERGVIGFLFFSLLIGVLLIKSRQKVQHFGISARFVFVGTLSFLVAGFFEVTLLRLWVVVVFFVFLGMLRARA